jgi:hypothetical protein
MKKRMMTTILGSLNMVILSWEKLKGELKGELKGKLKERHMMSPLMISVADAQRECKTNKEREKLDRMLEDHKKSLYPNCQNGLRKLGSTLELLKWKAEEGLSDSGFEKLLKMMRNMLPKDNEFPPIHTKPRRLSAL